MAKDERRLHRQFAAIARQVPPSRRVIHSLLYGRLRRARTPLGVLMVLGSFLSILPIFGLWMLPVGLMLLAVDVPFLRPTVSNLVIRARRRLSRLRPFWRRSEPR